LKPSITLGIQKRSGVMADKISLTPSQKRLVEVMQKINFGRIEALAIQNGEPVFNPPPRIFREIKFGSENGPRPESTKENFSLKKEVVELFEQLKGLDNGSIERINIKAGIPFGMSIESQMKY